MTVTDVITGISSLDRDELRAVQEAVNERHRYLRTIATATNKAVLTPGTRVRTRGLRPKYLNGLTGAVLPGDARRKGDLMVLVDESQRWHITRYSSTGRLSVPASALEAE